MGQLLGYRIQSNSLLALERLTMQEATILVIEGTKPEYDLQ